METLIPRIVIAGTHSNVGKTTVMVSLMGLLKERGLKVCSFKCGPDYLDPTYHKRVTGENSINLDSWMMGKEGVLKTFIESSQGFDIALIEGVMGLFDGANPKTDEGSTSEIAKTLKAPVLLVIDGSGMARSGAAVYHGFQNFDEGLNLKGALFNRLGSQKHLDILEEALGKEKSFGGITKGDQSFAFQGRHLGLETASGKNVSHEKLNYWKDHAAKNINLEKIIETAKEVDALSYYGVSSPKPSRPVKISYALDEAFHFYYPENLNAFRAFGGELTPFSPINDKKIPEGTQFVYLGGGYPELFAEKLSKNTSMMESLRSFADKGGAIYGECGGLIYLSKGCTLKNGKTFPFLGLLDLDIEMGDKLKSLGYTTVECLEESFLGPKGTKIKGHQFRYSDYKEQNGQKMMSLTKKRNNLNSLEGFRARNVIGTYVHSHFASNSAIPKNIIEWVNR